MKKLLVLIGIFGLSFGLVSCGQTSDFTSTQESTKQEGTTEGVTEKPTIPSPEAVQTKPNEYLQFQYDVDYEFRYRFAYYFLPGWVEDLGDALDPDAGRYVDELSNAGVNGIDEMFIVTYLKRYPVQREDFLEELEKDIEISIRLELDIIEEENEPPNPDIIYTFDNEIINAYYRRENPVVPDWSKTTVYESYAEYLAANP